MTTPPAHAAQTVDVSRASVIALAEKFEGHCEALYADDLDEVAAKLRALLDAKEKAEQELKVWRDAQPKQVIAFHELEADNARLRRDLSLILRECASVKSTSVRIVESVRILAMQAIAYTGHDDIGVTRT